MASAITTVPTATAIGPGISSGELAKRSPPSVSSEAERYLDFAVNTFFAASVWSDDDGGWHEGLSFFAGYMSKVATWWLDVARVALGIDGFRKPFFAHFGEPVILSRHRPDSRDGPGRPRLAPGSGRAVVDALLPREPGTGPGGSTPGRSRSIPASPCCRSSGARRRPSRPRRPPTSRRQGLPRDGRGRPLNTTLIGAADNVELRFKASPMGRWSHGHEPHNSFTVERLPASRSSSTTSTATSTARRFIKTGSGRRAPRTRCSSTSGAEAALPAWAAGW